MHAVVEKEVQPADRLENTFETAATRALNQSPPRPQILRNGGTDLSMELHVDQRRLIDAEEMSIGVALECLEDHTRGDAAPDAGFDDAARP
jgi:hypothetical protein